jgi:hypothetical protein
LLHRSFQAIFVIGDKDAGATPEPRHSIQLMIVSGFAEPRGTRHNDDRFCRLERGDDGPHSGMGNDDRGFGAAPLVLGGRQQINPFHVLWNVVRRTEPSYLRKG